MERGLRSDLRRTVSEWIPPRLRDWGMTRYGFRPLVPLIAALILAALIWKFQDAVFGSAWPWFWEGMKRLVAHPIGPFGLAFIVYLAVLVGAGWIESSPTVKAWRERRSAHTAAAPNAADITSLRQQLSAAEQQASRAEEKRQEVIAAVRYGPRALGPADLSPLNTIQLKFLHEHMLELRNVTISAGMALQKVMLAVLWVMWEEKPAGVRHCLATLENEHRLEPCKRSLQRFQEEVDFGRDTRESFARFYKWYAENRERISNLSMMIGHQLDKTDGYSLWIETDRQLEAALKHKLDVPQFGEIKAWLTVAALPKPIDSA